METHLSRRDGRAPSADATAATSRLATPGLPTDLPPLPPPVPPMPGPAFPEVTAPPMLANEQIDTLQSTQLSQQRTRLSQHRTGLSTHRTALSTHRTQLSERRTSLSEHRTRLSTHRTDLSERRTSLSEHRTSLSVERTVMSLGRTLLSWVRTALSMLTFGFSVVKFFQYLADQPGAVARPRGPHIFGVALVGLSVVALSMAIWQYVEERRALGDTKRHSPALLVALALLLMQVVALGYLLFGGR